ncbi:MAG: hypothetical protein AAF432_15825, partial [Planctomycetota bacterium]
MKLSIVGVVIAALVPNAAGSDVLLTPPAAMQDAISHAWPQSEIDEEINWLLDGDREKDALITLLRNNPRLRQGIEAKVELERGGALSVSRGPAPRDYERVRLVPHVHEDVADFIPIYELDIYRGTGLHRGKSFLPYTVTYQLNDNRAVLSVKVVSDAAGHDLQDDWLTGNLSSEACVSLLTRAHVHGVDDLSIRPNLHSTISNDIVDA